MAKADRRASPSRRARPFLKWAGGKNHLVDRLLDRLPARIGTYFEPFVGAGAVFFALAGEGRFERAVIGDLNRELVEAYLAVQRDLGAVLAALEKLATRNTREDYYRVRAVVPGTLAERAARLIYLNRTCFNGLYRVNSRGLFNVPFGDNPRATIRDEERLAAASRVLQGVAIVEQDFEVVAGWAVPGDAVYLDPPYYPLSRTSSFAAYNRSGFAPADHARLATVLHSLRERGVAAVVSNSDCAETRRLFGAFDMEVIHAGRSINSVGSKRGKIAELVLHTGAASP